MNQQVDPQAVIDRVKADSYDQISGMNRQLNQMAAQLNAQNGLIQQISNIVDPGNANLTQGELLGKLQEAFKPTDSTDKETEDE